MLTGGQFAIGRSKLRMAIDLARRKRKNCVSQLFYSATTTATAALTAARVNAMSTNKHYVYIAREKIKPYAESVNRREYARMQFVFQRQQNLFWTHLRLKKKNQREQQKRKKNENKWTQRQLQLKHTHSYLSSPQITIYINNNDCKQTPAVVKKLKRWTWLVRMKEWERKDREFTRCSTGK